MSRKISRAAPATAPVAAPNFARLGKKIEELEQDQLVVAYKDAAREAATDTAKQAAEDAAKQAAEAHLQKLDELRELQVKAEELVNAHGGDGFKDLAREFHSDAKELGVLEDALHDLRAEAQPARRFFGLLGRGQNAILEDLSAALKGAGQEAKEAQLAVNNVLAADRGLIDNLVHDAKGARGLPRQALIVGAALGGAYVAFNSIFGSKPERAEPDFQRGPQGNYGATPRPAGVNATSAHIQTAQAHGIGH